MLTTIDTIVVKIAMLGHTLQMLNPVVKIVVQAIINLKMLNQVVNLIAQPVLPSMATEPHAQFAR
jgi:hypothetical protein